MQICNIWMGVGGVKIQFLGPKFFFMIFWFISYGKISDWLNISNKVSWWDAQPLLLVANEASQ